MKTNKIDVQNAKQSTVVETNSEPPLPGSNINNIHKPVHTRPTVNVTTVSRANTEENVVAPIFGTGKFSAALSTNAFGF